MQNSFNAPQLVKIEADQAGQRIDNYLIAQLKGVPKSHIYRILRKGEVRVNKRRIKPHYRIQASDEVRIPPIRVSERPATLRPSSQLIEQLQDSVLYEDKKLLILNKPAGLAVHGGSGVSLGVIEALRQARVDIHYLELVHRLDRETSGCLLLAKRRSALKLLQEQLRNKNWEKYYLMLVKGRWQGGARRVELPLQKNVLRSGERIVRVSASGKEAITHFTPLQVTEQWSLLRAQLLTGRTHQLRVHCAHLHHPIAGDERYGDKEFNQWVKSKGLARMFLHANAVKISGLHELDELPDGRLHIVAPLDAALSGLLHKLGSTSDWE